MAKNRQHIFPVELMEKHCACTQFVLAGYCDLTSIKTVTAWLRRVVKNYHPYRDGDSETRTITQCAYVANGWLASAAKDRSLGYDSLPTTIQSTKREIRAMLKLGRIVLWEHQTGRMWFNKHDPRSRFDQLREYLCDSCTSVAAQELSDRLTSGWYHGTFNQSIASVLIDRNKNRVLISDCSRIEFQMLSEVCTALGFEFTLS